MVDQTESIKTQIVDALIVRLNAISISNGYWFNLDPGQGGGGAREIDDDFQSARDLPFIDLTIWNEELDVEYNDAYGITGNLFLELNVPLSSDPTVGANRQMERFISDVKRVLDTARQDTPLAVVGCLDVRVNGVTILPFDVTDNRPQAIFDAEVKFRHLIGDPTSAGTP